MRRRSRRTCARVTRGGARQQLQEVQRRPFGGEQRARVASMLAHHAVGRHVGAFVVAPVDACVRHPARCTTAVEPVAPAQHRGFAHPTRAPARAALRAPARPVQSPRPMSSSSASRMLRARACSSVSLNSKRSPASAASASGRSDVRHEALRAAWRSLPGAPPRSRACARCSRAPARASARARGSRRCRARRHGDHALQAVHRHPRAVRAALAGGAVAGGGRFDQRLARRQLAHAVHDAVVGGDDEFAGARLSTTAFSSCEVEPTTSACCDHALRATRGAPAPCAFGCSLLQQLELDALELVVHDAGAVPHQHVGAGLLLDVAAQVAVGRPQDLLAAARAGARTIASAHELVTIQSARAFTAALVLA